MKDSFEFAEFIRQRKISNKEEMVSFDVESLFTNVPTNETVDIIIKDLYNDNKLKIIIIIIIIINIIIIVIVIIIR